MLDAALDGTFKGLYVQGEDIPQSDPDTHHVTAGLAAMECVVVQDLFLNETANYAHVFLPGSTFLEKNGTFINAERRIQSVRKVMAPRNGYEDWEITCLISEAMGYPMHYDHPSEIMDEIARLTPTFAGVSFERIEQLGSIQWPCNDRAPEGTPVMHIGASCAARASSSSPSISRPTKSPARATRCCSPPVASSASITSEHKPAAPPISFGTRKTGWKSIRTTPNSGASAMAIG